MYRGRLQPRNRVHVASVCVRNVHDTCPEPSTAISPARMAARTQRTAKEWLEASSSSDEEDLSPEAAERRQRAIQLLAKALHKPANGEEKQSEADNTDAEVRLRNCFLFSPHPLSRLLTHPPTFLTGPFPQLSPHDARKRGGQVRA